MLRIDRVLKYGGKITVKGANAASLKFSATLCSRCNNTRTQPHDLAWQKLSTTVRRQNPPLVRGDELPTAQAFLGNAKREMLNVHLYFLKLFGCYAVEYKVPLPISTFAVAILSQSPHPNVYLDFVAFPRNAGTAEVMIGDMRTMNAGSVTVGATWFYIVGTVGVHLTYAEPGHPRYTRRQGWHPDRVGPQPRLR